ncbi:DMT family transporter [Paracoccus sp. CPCC 101403]|uniref:DMT family transporter n=1 Tax=Paracoccus broussonetiae TaxID=3075834 RepID=A0ABU3EE20_9RHOB|nr:DMT family transporter [Paracoccus sp. CPCC 101403]MDT1062380.1 DMT family transporter [Paracoccus sp. CPCC 101403]
MSRAGPSSVAAGVAWLMTDMTLVTTMQVLVKIQGVTYPAIQLVFLRALIGLVAIAPLLWLRRHEIAAMRQPGRNALRVACNALALTLNFVALAQLPIAMVNAIGFSRPLVTMALASVLLHEHVVRRRWVAGLCALLAACLIAYPMPQGGSAISLTGLVAALGATLFGATAVVQTRALATESPAVMMLFYTVGLAVLTAIPAIIVWRPVASADWPTLLAIGILAQAGQYCFLRAYRSHEASLLAPLSYLSILLAAFAGWLAFGDRPGIGFPLGTLILLVVIRMLTRKG